MKKLICGLLIAVVCYSTHIQSAWAHAACACSTGSSGIAILNGSRQGGASFAKPSSFVWTSFSLSQQDENAGQMYDFLLGGEYAILPWLGAGGIVPIKFSDHNFRSRQTGLGDVSAYAKFLFLKAPTVSMFATSMWSFPTGDENNGFGNGAVGQTVDVSTLIRLKSWTVLLSSGIQFVYDTPVRPTLSFTAGVNSPSVWNERVDFGLYVTSPILISSPVFTNGSGKLFVNPEARYHITKDRRWTLNVGARISAIDFLNKKTGVTLATTDPTLFVDSLYSLYSGLTFQFK